jgi:hypothetical protein
VRRPSANRRKDLVHAPIVAGLRVRGILVEDMPEPGDVLCYGWHAGLQQRVFIPIEFKSDAKSRGGSTAKLTKTQAARVMPIPIVHDLPEALALFGLFSIESIHPPKESA